MQMPKGTMPTGPGLLLAAPTCVATEEAVTTDLAVEVLTLMVDPPKGMQTLLEHQVHPRPDNLNPLECDSEEM